MLLLVRVTKGWLVSWGPYYFYSKGCVLRLNESVNKLGGERERETDIALIDCAGSMPLRERYSLRKPIKYIYTYIYIYIYTVHNYVC